MKVLNGQLREIVNSIEKANSVINKQIDLKIDEKRKLYNQMNKIKKDKQELNTLIGNLDTQMQVLSKDMFKQKMW